MSTIATTGLNVIAVFVSDLARAKTFYTDQLGFKHGQDMDPGVLLEAGDLSLYLEGGREPRDAGAASAGVAEVCPCLAVASVQGAHDALAAAGVTIALPLKQFGYQFAMFRFADPDGNVFEIAGTP